MVTPVFYRVYANKPGFFGGGVYGAYVMVMIMFCMDSLSK
jgi:hypothetical protein